MACYLITGGTGLIGSALCKQLIKQHNVIVLSRFPQKVQQKCGPQVSPINSLTEISEDTIIDVIINLAGEPIADKPWTDKRKQELEKSRINLTADLVKWIATRQQKPACLISGSAIGWYGDKGDEILNENSSFHDEYSHQLCDAWEQQALLATESGLRVCISRTGLVLAPKGGFLKKMLLPFQLGLGGRIGDGTQFMSWVHITDMVNLLIFLAENPQAQGVFNACSPSPVSNQRFSQLLAAQLHRFAILPAPAWLLKLALGEMSGLLLTGQRVKPEKLLNMGFEFQFNELQVALADVLPKK